MTDGFSGEFNRAEASAKTVAAANALIFCLDLDGAVAEWNTRATTLVGYTWEQVKGRSFVHTLIPANYQAMVQEIFADTARGIDCNAKEITMNTRDGSSINVVLSTSALRQGLLGGVSAIVCVALEMPSSSKMIVDGPGLSAAPPCARSRSSAAVTDALPLELNYVSKVLDCTGMPMMILGRDGDVIEWSRGAVENFGYTKSEVASRRFVDFLVVPQCHQIAEAALQKAISGVDVEGCQLQLLSKNGKIQSMSFNVAGLVDTDDNVTAVMMTGVKGSEETLEFAPEDHSQLLARANALIIGIDMAGRITEWNEKAAAMTGFNKQETLGMPFTEKFIRTDQQETIRGVLSKAMRGEESTNFEIALYTENRGYCEILLNTSVRQDSQGNVTGVVGVGQDITDLKKVIATSKLIADDLTRLIETANAPIFGINTEGRVTEWNAKATEVSSYSKAETMGKHLVKTFIHLEYRASVEAVFEKALLGQGSANFELPLFTKTGQRREVLLNATPRRGPDGQVVGVIGVGQDITELNHQRKEALRTADDLSRLIQSANAPIFGVDTQGRVTEWNHKLAELSKFTKEETLGKSLVHFITDDYKQMVSYILLKALNGEETANFEFPLVKNGDRTAILLLNATTRRGPDGVVIGVIGVGQDITTIRTMTAEQQRVADDLSRLIENANAPIFGVDEDFMVTEWNRKSAELMGYTKEETIGKHFIENFIQQENRSSVEQVFHKALSGWETSNYELLLLSKTGKRSTVLLNATTRRDAQGKVLGVVGVGQDITGLNMVMLESKRIAEDLTRLIETANAPIFGIDTEGKVTEWNAKASSLLGFSKVETMGKHLVSNFITDEFKASVNKVLSAALSGVDTADFQVSLYTKDGARIDILLNAATRRGPDGTVIGVIGVGQDITKIREITAEQQRVADDLSRLIENANAPIFGVDTNGKVTEWNRKAAELVGYGKDETLGQDLVQNFIQPEDRSSVSQVLQKALSGVETSNYELPLLSKTGKRSTVLLNATTRRDAKGGIIGVVGVGQDISQLNQVMAESRRVADDLTRLIDTANAPIFGIDTDGAVTEWNAKASSLLGYKKEEAIGKSFIEYFITEEFRHKVQEVVRAALTGKETANFELSLFNKHGSRIDILLNATTRRGPDGIIIGVIGVGQDITQIRKMSSEQTRIADDLSRLIDNANAPIFGVDVHGLVTEWNRKAADLVGYSKDETIGKHLVQNFIQPEDRSSVDSVLQKALTGIETSNFDLPLISKIGKRSSVLLNATTRRDANGAIIGVVGVGQDITKLNQVMAEAKRVADDLTRLIETSNAPIFGIDTNGNVTEWNRKAWSLLGFKKEEAMGKSFVENFITLGLRDRVNGVLKAALRGEETSNFDLSLFTKNGSKVDILLNATTRRGPEGTVIGMIGVGQDITEMRRMSLEQRRVADDFCRLIENANAPIFGVDVNGLVTEWNRKAADLVGHTKDETIGKHLVQNFIQPENRRAVDQVLQKALTGIETSNFELPLISKTGKRFTVLLNANTRRDAEGRVTGVVGVGQDITSINEVMAESKRVADDQTRLIETANAPIFGIDTNGTVMIWNRMAAKISQFAKSEAMGRNLVESFITEEYKQSVSMVLERALGGIETPNFEFPLVTKNRVRKVHILMSATPLRGADGRIMGMVGVGQDITDLRENKDKADRTACELERLIDTANAPIFGVDKAGNVTEWNAKMTNISGVTRAEAMGQSLVGSFLFDPEAKENVARVLEKAFQGTETSNFELRLRQLNSDDSGTEKVAVLLLNATPRVDSTNEIVGVIGVGQDITEITSYKTLEERKTRFMAMVSHELRSPIHGICGLSDALARTESDSHKKKQLGMIRNCSTRLLDMVSNIMDVSSMKSQNSKLNREQCNIPLVMEETCHLLQHATDKHGSPVKKPEVDVINQVDQDMPLIEADSHRISQVFYNLVMNALKFTKKGKVIITSNVDPAGQWVELHVEDTGIGINPNHLDQIFEPFEQEDEGEARQFEGIGLGLSISRGVVRQHGGDISVRTVLGQGSTFTVVLPSKMGVKLENCPGARGADQQKEKETKAVSKRTVFGNSCGELVKPENVGTECRHEANSLDANKKIIILSVDDTEVNQEVIKAALQSEEYEIHTAMSGHGALNYLRTHTTLPDVMLLDVMMPGMSGLEVCRKVRTELNLNQCVLPIIMVSAKAPPMRSCVEGLKSGTNDYIVKPFDSEELRARVRTAIQVKQGYTAKIAAEEQTKLLFSMVPDSIAKRIVADGKPVAETRPKVSVLFTRIVGWSEIVDSVEPSVAMDVFREVVGIFERLSDEECFFKVDSMIGDSFVVVAGHDGQTGSCEQLLSLGSAMIHAVKRVRNVGLDRQLTIRASIHSGSACCGVIGTTLPRYSLFGRMMDFVAVMDYHAPPSYVYLSQAACDDMNWNYDGPLLGGQRLVKHLSLNVDLKQLVSTYVAVPEGDPGPPLVTEHLPRSQFGSHSSNFQEDRFSQAVTSAVDNGAPNIIRQLPAPEEQWHILSVDDDSVNQEVVRGIFESEGYTLTIAMDGDEAIATVDKIQREGSQMPHLLLLDSMMPGKSGLEVCKHLRKVHNLVSLPIIMVTCRSSKEDTAQALNAGCNDYVTKPFQRVELLARVRVQTAMIEAVSELLMSVGKKGQVSLPQPEPAPPHALPLPPPVPTVQTQDTGTQSDPLPAPPVAGAAAPPAKAKGMPQSYKPDLIDIDTRIGVAPREESVCRDLLLAPFLAEWQCDTLDEQHKHDRLQLEVLQLRLNDKISERATLRRRCREKEVKLAGASAEVEFYKQMLDEADDMLEKQDHKLETSDERFAHLNLSLQLSGLSPSPDP